MIARSLTVSGVQPSDRPTDLPHSPGVYRFASADGAIIYVGKAKDLANRVTSYFSDPATLHPRTALMVAEAVTLTWLVLNSETEALLVEQQLIAANQPRYNVRLRQLHAYPVVAVTSDTFPRALLTHNPPRDAEIFGPFPATKQLGPLLDQLNVSLQLRTCSPSTYKEARRAKRPCLLFELKRCSGPCIDAVDVDAYAESVDTLRSVFTGRDRSVAATLLAEMNEAAKTLHYEDAAILRDRLTAVQSLGERDHLELPANLDADALAVKLGPATTALAVLSVRSGRLVGFHSLTCATFDLAETSLSAQECTQPSWQASVLQAAALAFYRDHEYPPLVLVGADLAQLAGALVALRPTKQRPPRVLHPRRGPRAKLQKRAAAHASDVARRATARPSDVATRSASLLDLQNALGLSRAPLRIECYDNAHLQGTNYVGAMVVFVDALAKPAHYRSFNFNDPNHDEVVKDDLAAMRAMLTRRLHYLVNGPLDDPSLGATPDLLLIDGGPTQLAVASEVVAQLGLDIAVAALAKRYEEIYLPSSPHPVQLSANSEALYLVQRLRDEAHRRANTAHAKRRTKAMTISTLDGVTGLGPARQARLLDDYATVATLRNLSLTELESLTYLPTRVARSLYTTLHPTEPDPKSTDTTTTAPKNTDTTNEDTDKPTPAKPNAPGTPSP